MKELFKGINKALKKDGLILYGSRSGGGLRMISIEEPPKRKDRSGKLRAFGAHPNLREALMFASVDYLAGGGTAENHYLTGSSHPEDELDRWLLCGHDIFAKANGNKIRLEARACDDRSILSVEKPRFAEVYNTLCGMVTEEHFEKAYSGH